MPHTHIPTHSLEQQLCMHFTSKVSAPFMLCVYYHPLISPSTLVSDFRGVGVFLPCPTHRLLPAPCLRGLPQGPDIGIQADRRSGHRLDGCEVGRSRCKDIGTNVCR